LPSVAARRVTEASTSPPVSDRSPSSNQGWVPDCPTVWSSVSPVKVWEPSNIRTVLSPIHDGLIQPPMLKISSLLVCLSACDSAVRRPGVIEPVLL
jgi:hypothetical protein